MVVRVSPFQAPSLLAGRPGEPASWGGGQACSSSCLLRIPEQPRASTRAPSPLSLPPGAVVLLSPRLSGSHAPPSPLPQPTLFTTCNDNFKKPQKQVTTTIPAESRCGSRDPTQASQDGLESRDGCLFLTVTSLSLDANSLALSPLLPQGWPQTGSCLAFSFGLSVAYLICLFLAFLLSAWPHGQEQAGAQPQPGEVWWLETWGGRGGGVAPTR